MGVRQFIRPDVAASAIAHLSVLGLVFFFTEVHPFGSVTAEPITVDIVTADQVEKAEAKPDQIKPDPPMPFPTDSLTKDDAAAAPAPAPAAAPQKASPPQPQKETSAQKKETRREAALQPQVQPSPQPQFQPPQPQAQQQPQPQPQSPLPASQTQSQQPPPPTASPSLGYVPPEPDVTVKYHVLLGLPPDVGPPSSSGDKPGDGIDARASEKADVASSAIAEFRRHLKTCSKLPASVAASDNVHVKLRVLMRPDGKLAAEPFLIEGTASMKALELKQSAVSALVACQPYAMLPVDRYKEWKVLDLFFTPDDFAS